MNKISSDSLLSIVTKLLIIIVITKAISLGLWYYLPSDGVELKKEKDYQPKYARVDFKNMVDTQRAKPKKKKEKKKVISGPSITNMILKGLYGKGEKGLAIIALKKSPKKTTIVEVGDNYEGYILKLIRIDSIVFEKNNQEYILSVEKLKKQDAIKRVSKKSSTKKSKAIEEDDDEPKNVSRSDIGYYAKNPKQIWRDISIREIKKNGKIDGFKIYKINPNSKFASLGLKKGDVIIKANNIRLDSYAKAFKLYGDIDKIDTMSIVLRRDNEEKELVYEIN
jgi:general secretion pathway protein C